MFLALIMLLWPISVAILLVHLDLYIYLLGKTDPVYSEICVSPSNLCYLMTLKQKLFKKSIIVSLKDLRLKLKSVFCRQAD